tara:strand:+ start:2777 stop:3259 length:483 start_codon:yes stop_codon:yes gene_type:complete
MTILTAIFFSPFTWLLVLFCWVLRLGFIKATPDEIVLDEHPEFSHLADRVAAQSALLDNFRVELSKFEGNLDAFATSMHELNALNQENQARLEALHAAQEGLLEVRQDDKQRLINLLTSSKNLAARLEALYAAQEGLLGVRQEDRQRLIKALRVLNGDEA